jgi:hypothetical protein
MGGCAFSGKFLKKAGHLCNNDIEQASNPFGSASTF